MSCENNLKIIKLQYSDSGRPDFVFSCTQLQLLICFGVRSGSNDANLQTLIIFANENYYLPCLLLSVVHHF